MNKAPEKYRRTMTNPTEMLRAQQQRLEALEREKQNLNRSLYLHNDQSTPCCHSIRQRLSRVNDSIEEVYSQLSLLRIRQLMGF